VNIEANGKHTASLLVIDPTTRYSQGIHVLATTLEPGPSAYGSRASSCTACVNCSGITVQEIHPGHLDVLSDTKCIYRC
jgi:hypothetical protein